MAKKRKFHPMTVHHRGAKNTIHGRAIPGSPAEYLLMKRNYLKIDDSFVLDTFKKGKQMLFNSQVIHDMLELHGELHCELCGKEDLQIYKWYDYPGSEERPTMATADHFFPKVMDKENLAFETDNIICACYKCNNDKADDLDSLTTIKFPYPGTIERLAALGKKLKIIEK